MNEIAKGRVRLTREILWLHPNGKWCVVAGPFPDAFSRSETRDTVERASKMLVTGIYARPGTQKPGTFAKVLVTDIVEIHGGKNEFGPVSP